MPHDPPPPQAEGRNIFRADSVESSDEPGDTSIGSSPLMKILTFPWGTNFFLANNNTVTSNNITKRNIAMLMPIVVNGDANKIIVYYFYGKE
jgi:hypothetical protein